MHIKDGTALGNVNRYMRRKTQAIAKAAAEHGFAGLLYISVRLPKNLITPDWNLVVFRPDCVVNDDPK